LPRSPNGVPHGPRNVIVGCMRMGCSDCGCVIESGKRVVVCAELGCCCTHLPIADEPSVEVLAERVKAALESAEPSAFADLLDPDVRWGAPDDAKPPCRNRGQVLRWYERGRAEGTRARVVGVETHGDKIVVELRVFHVSEPASERERWQVMTCKGGRVVDIRGYDTRDEALARVNP
jgi:hypothetical protein